MRFPDIARNRRALLVEVFRFGLVGLGATAFYALLLWSGIWLLALPAYLSAVIASVSSIAASYAGHYFYTFGASQRHARSLPLFLAVSCLLVVANAWLVDQIDQAFAWRGAPIVASCLFYPAASFLLNRWIVFRR